MKIRFTTKPCVPVEQLERNVKVAKARGIPEVWEATRRSLAVVGGGHSAKDELATLLSWDGDIWACGSAYPWCKASGLDTVYFCVDPSDEMAPCFAGADRAIVSTTSSPAIFDVVPDVRVFNLISSGTMLNHGVTTATAAPHLAVMMGYKEVTFFGCESSFLNSRTHLYKHEQGPYTLRVECNGKAFLTRPDFLMQAELLAEIIKACPSVFKERCGGLLREMVSGDYDITHVSATLKNDLVFKEAA